MTIDLDEKFAIVGWKVVPFPAVSERNRVFTERLRTSAPAVSGTKRRSGRIQPTRLGSTHPIQSNPSDPSPGALTACS